MKNKLSHLNDHLFAQLERLGEEGLTLEQIEAEAKRADAIVDLSDQILRTADMHLKAATLIANHGERFHDKLPMIAGPASQ
ncbi:hypothetical protein [Brevundimonas sp. C43]|uniref:hypothetical protein n=1 Tax=Brevundimonas sp. C43 TaxID=3068314 RepID=UPI00273FB065|nr:hypothetical protein [Brevundimonas sp. C43]